MAYFPNSKQEYEGGMTPFYMEPAKKDVMGYKLLNVSAGDVILPGTPIKTNEASKTAVVCKYAYVKGVANDKKTLTVKRDHHFKAGEKCAISGEASLVELTISSVSEDRSVIVLSEANENIAAGDVLVEVVSESIQGSEGSESIVLAKALPNRIVDTIARIDGLDYTCSATHDVVVLQNVVHYPEEYLNKASFPGTILLVGNPKIMFTIQ